MTTIKKIDIALLLGLIITIIVSSTTSFARELDEISDSVLRLHILANSDSKEDQELKIKVRDAILAETGELFISATSRKEVEQIAVYNIEKIEDIALKTITENGYNYSVECKLVNMEFDDRTYENITLPAGYYDALRVTIGEAKGKNWWCVMYPQFCIAPSLDQNSLIDPQKTDLRVENTEETTDYQSFQLNQNIETSAPMLQKQSQLYLENQDEEKLSLFKSSQIKIMKQPQKYKVKFKAVEWLKKVTSFL